MQKKMYSLILLMICFSILFSSLSYAETYPVIVETKKHAILSAQRDGVITELKADTGNRVKKNDFLGMILHEDLLNRKKQFEDRNIYWKEQVSELSKLNNSGFASNTEIAKARMEVKNNENEIRYINTQIQNSKFYAPFDGIIVKRHVRPFESVRQGQPVIELYNPAELYFVTSLPSQLVMKFKSGEAYNFFVSDINTAITAKLTIIEPTVDVQSNTIKTYWLISQSKENNEKKLLSGMKGIMEIKTK